MAFSALIGEEAKFAQEQAVKLLGQLGNWTIAANAAGVAFVLSAARDVEGLTLPGVAGFYLIFVLGIAFGFCGHGLLAVSQLMRARRTSRVSTAMALGEYLTRLDRSALDAHPELAEAKRGGMNDATQVINSGQPGRTERTLPLSGSVCYGVSAGCALFGLIAPLAWPIL